MKIITGELEHEMSVDQFVDYVSVKDSRVYIPEVDFDMIKVNAKSQDNEYKDSYFARRSLYTNGGRRYRLLVASKEFEQKIVFYRTQDVLSKLTIDNVKNWTLPSFRELHYLHEHHREDFHEALYWTNAKEYCSLVSVFDFKKNTFNHSKTNSKNYLRPVHRVYL